MSGPAARFDREAAFTHYASLDGPHRTFVAVAQRFGVSDTAVRKVARRDRWLERVRELDRRARAQVETKIVRDRAREIARSLEIIALAESELLERLRAGETEVRLSDLPALVRLRQLLIGEPDLRIETAEVRLILSGLLSTAVRFVPSEQRQAFLAAARETTSGLLELPAGELEEGP